MRRNLLLLVFVVLACWVAYQNHCRAQQERRAKNIERLGGFIDHGGAFIVLGGPEVTDETMKHLVGFPELQYLALPETAITPKGILQLQQFDLLGLEVLRTPVSARFYVQVAALPKLKVLKMAQTGSTDECLAELSRLHDLEVLDLSNCPISAEGVRHLVELKNLRVLSLYATLVGDDCVAYLREIPHLERVDIELTRMTPHGVNALHDASPTCQISY
ncbi:MAG TPA: hypothetical protein VHC22_25360 [Pirellulales bacterium]|nr:hypothetical protein [Pirellulales bacterium]